MCRRPPPGFPSLETTECGVGMDDAFIMILYNMHLRICALEWEKAELQIKNDQLDTDIWREERAIQRTEEWILENEENLPKLENILLDAEQKLDQCTVLLVAVIEESEKLLPKKDGVYEEREMLKATPDSLAEKLEHPEEVEEGVQGLIQGYEEHYGTLETAEVLQQVVEVVEETTRKETNKEKKEKKKKKDKKKRTGCFAALWNWAWR